jgi:4'-phosphopantetheinyl transferase
MKINPGEAHVWSARLDRAAAGLQGHWDRLSPDEQVRAQRFHFTRDRRRFITAHGILRALLGRYLEADASGIRFQINRHGKPGLKARGGRSPGLNFNLSHSADRALMAFTEGIPVGIDIERIRRDREVESLVRRFFAPREVKEFLSFPEKERIGVFYTGWTRKEAFLKATGRGLSIGLDRFEVSLHPRRAARILSLPEEEVSERGWTLVDIPAGRSCRAALAARASSVRPRLFTWENEPLSSGP